MIIIYKLVAKNIIKKASIVFGSFVAGLMLLIFITFIGLYSGPKSLPSFITNYIKSTVVKLAPESSDIQIEDILISLNKKYKIYFELKNFAIVNRDGSEFKTSNISIAVNPVAFLLNERNTLYNIIINQPELIHSVLSDDLKNNPLPIDLIKNYINSHKDLLLKFSLSFNNINLNVGYNDESKKSVISLNKVKIYPKIVANEFVPIGVGKLSINGTENALNATIDFASNKYLSLKGTATNLANNTLKAFDLGIAELEGAEFGIDVAFSALLKSFNNVEFIEFDATSTNGLIRQNNFFDQDFSFKKFKFKGYCVNNCDHITIEKLNFDNDDLEITSNLEVKSLSTSKILTANFAVNQISIAKIEKYWPKPLLTSARKWIFEHIDGGSLQSAEGTFEFDFDKLAKNEEEQQHYRPDVNIIMNIADANLKYLPYTDPLSNVEATLNVKTDRVDFDVKQANISDLVIKNAHGSINNLASKDVSIFEFETKIDAKLEDLIHTSLQHAKINKEISAKGTADGDFRVSLPITDNELTIDDIDLKANLNLKSVTAHDFYKNLTLDKGNFKVKISNFLMNLDGNFKINDKYDSNIDGEYNFKLNRKSFKLSSILKWDNLTEFGVTKPSFITGKFGLNLSLDQDQTKLKQTYTFDLGKSTINHPFTGIKKAAGEAAFFRATIEGDTAHDLSIIKISDYHFSSSGAESKGSAELTKDHNILSIHSSHTKLANGDFKFDLNTSKNGGAMNINITGESFDLGALNFHQSPPIDSNAEDKAASLADYIITTKLDKIILKNNKFIVNPIADVSINSGKIQTLQLKGGLGDDKASSIDFSVKYPKVSLVSNNASALISGLGVTNKMINGTINLQGTLDNNNFEGIVDIRDFRMLKAPVMAKIISLTSLTTPSLEGLSNIFSNRGIKFDRLKCPLNLKGGLLSLNNCYVKGPTLTFTADGKLNFNDNSIKINGNVIPENILNLVARNIPVIGNAFKGKKDHALIGASFTVEGSIEDPQTSTNPLSLLAPGFLKEAFR